MAEKAKKYNNPVQATLSGITSLFAKKERVGRLSTEERLDGKKVMITGSSSGLGFATAIEVAKLGAEVIMAVRSGIPNKGEEVKKASGSKKIHMVPVDLSDFSSIDQMIDELQKKFGSLDILICNAAVVAKKGIKTKSGLEQMFMVNYLSSFYLVRKLLKLNMIHSDGPDKARIVFVNSESHRDPKGFKWDDFAKFVPHSVGKTIELYGYYKLLLLSFARELSRRLSNEKANISVFSLCPGPVNSNIAREAPPIFKPLLRVVFGIFFRSPETACEPVVYLATAKAEEHKEFDYFFLMGRKAIDEKAEDKANAKKLWQLSEDLLQKIQVE